MECVYCLVQNENKDNYYLISRLIRSRENLEAGDKYDLITQTDNDILGVICTYFVI